MSFTLAPVTNLESIRVREELHAMKGTHPTRLLSLLLALIFCIYLVPTEALAIEAKKSILETERTYARDYDSVESPDIVSEIASSRDEYQKEYLLSNGQHMISAY